MKISKRLIGILLAASCLLYPAMAAALTLGQVDNFENGTTQGWMIGAPIPSPADPQNEPTGGPAGAGDHYLLLTALGPSDPNVGSRLSVMNQTQWAGKYLTAGINAITMWVNNFGTMDLSLRLVLDFFPVPANGFPPDFMVMSTNPVFLPAGSGWTPVVFSLNPKQLTALVGTVQTALTTPGELRIVHNPLISWPPPKMEASLGVDNITAVRQRSHLPFLPLLLFDD